MAVTLTNDIARMLDIQNKKVYFDNYNSYPKEYPGFCKTVSSTQQTEKYDTVGNLKSAESIPEGDSIKYGKIEQAYQTTIKNGKAGNGFEVSLEAFVYDQFKVNSETKSRELANTMKDKEETDAVYWIDNAETVNLADGVPLASNSRPCFNAPGVFNDTLATASSLTNPENHKAMMNMFHAFKNHQGRPLPSWATNGLTHAVNMFTIEEVYQSSNKAQEISNTKNVLGKLDWSYSHYMTSQTAWMMWDKKLDHIIFQEFSMNQSDYDVDRIHTHNYYWNMLSLYGIGAINNVGVVYNAGV